MCRGCVYIEQLPEVVLDGGGAKMEYVSGGETYIRRYPRHLWRRFLEREIARLNEHEHDERDNRAVVRLSNRGGPLPRHS